MRISFRSSMSSGMGIPCLHRHLISGRVQTARPGVEPRKTKQRIELGRFLADLLADLADRGQQHVDLDRLACLDILQHRRLEGTELASDGVAILSTLLDGTADPRADGRGFSHYLETE